MSVAILAVAILALLVLIVISEAVNRGSDALARIALVAEQEERRRDELERDLRAMR